MASSGSVFTEYLRVTRRTAHQRIQYETLSRISATYGSDSNVRSSARVQGGSEIADVKPSAEALARVKVPFVAQTADGCRIVTEVSPQFVSVIGPHDAKAVIMPVGKFVDEWSSKAISASPTSRQRGDEFQVSPVQGIVKGYREVAACSVCCISCDGVCSVRPYVRRLVDLCSICVERCRDICVLSGSY